MGTNPLGREGQGCLCCGGYDLAAGHTVVSPYLAFKALGSGPVPCVLYRCLTCDFRFYDRGLTEEEANSYYRGYRDETYFVERNRYEPYYTRAVHDGLSEYMGSKGRRTGLNRAFVELGFSTEFECVVDYGGGDGALIGDLSASRKISFDPSGTPGCGGIEIIADRASLPTQVDLVICAQVLEHVSDPNALLEEMISLLKPGGFLYLEVPDQIWRGLPGRLRQSVVEWLCRRPRLLLAADIYATAFRVKLGILPPFGFVPMREHINFFSAQALRTLSDRGALRLLGEGRTNDRSFFLVAEKGGA